MFKKTRKIMLTKFEKLNRYLELAFLLEVDFRLAY